MYKRILLSTSIAAALMVGNVHAEQTATGDIRAAVTSVINGSSFVVEPNGIPMQIDLESANAPEMEQPYGPEAKEHLSELILNKTVVIKQSRTLEYRHISAVVSTADIDINKKMIADGFAWADENFSYSSNLVATQNTAKKNKAGLWKSPNPKSPTEYRLGTGLKPIKPIINVSYPDNETDTDSSSGYKGATRTPAAILVQKPTASLGSIPAPPPTAVPVAQNTQATRQAHPGNGEKVFLNAEKIQQAREQNIKSQTSP